MKIEKRVEIPPLRKLYPDRRPYFRRAEVQEELENLYKLHISEVAARAEITDSGDPNYVSSEAVLHFVRQSKDNGDTAPYGTLFMVIRQRIMKALPVFNKRLSDSKSTDNPYEAEVRERVVDKFTEMLCRDRESYLERLDYFEAMFNGAVCALRRTAKRDTSKRVEQEKNEVLIIDEAVAGSGDDFEGVLQNLNEPSKNEDSGYRFELLSAINNLPDNERRVIELLIQGFLLKEVAEIVECTEKTSRSRRNRARTALAEVLEREDLL